jgi:catechol 2,3-dioxygenase-like lactoylglutathione lyase family enzyme
MAGIALHHVQVSCSAGEEPAAREFYRDLLGIPEAVKPPVLATRGGVWFRGPACEVHVGVEAGFRPAGKAHPAFVVDDIDALADRLTARGYPVGWDDAFPGYRRFYTVDGSGNRVEILSPEPADSSPAAPVRGAYPGGSPPSAES